MFRIITFSPSSLETESFRVFCPTQLINGELGSRRLDLVGQKTLLDFRVYRTGLKTTS